MRNSLLFLGCGSSVGVPIPGCQCHVCKSNDTRNQRLRTSAMVIYKGKKILIDVGPDIRQQVLRSEIVDIDGVLLTHSHNDHVAGLNDIKPFSYFSQKPIPMLLSQTTADDIQLRYDYLFNKGFFSLNILPQKEGVINFEGVEIDYCTYHQAGMPVNGYRFGSLAYLTDMSQFDSSIYDQLAGVKYLVISALRFLPSEIHLTIDQAIAFSKKIGAEQTWFTHLSHDLEYEQANSYLPINMRLAYDGMKFTFE